MKILNNQFKTKGFTILEHGQLWSHMPLTPAFRRLRQKDHQFVASLGYIVRYAIKDNKILWNDEKNQMS